MQLDDSKIFHLVEAKEPSSHIQIVIPQFIQKKWWHNLLHNQTALLLRLWLIRQKSGCHYDSALSFKKVVKKQHGVYSMLFLFTTNVITISLNVQSFVID